MHVSTSNASTTTELTEPRLPQELERIIFEIAARSDRNRTLPVLVRVARRVREWLQAILYDTVVLLNADFYEGSKSPFHHPPRFPSGAQILYVRNLLVSHMDNPVDSEPDWKELLPKCHNLEDLAIWSLNSTPDADTLPTLISAIQSPLRTVTSHGLLRLSITLSDLFPDGPVDFSHEIFRDLTHLEVLSFPRGCEHWEEGNNLACLQNLRYFCVAYYDSLNAHPSTVPMEILKRCLEECRALDVLVLPTDRPWVAKLTDGCRRIVAFDGTAQEVPEDRVVVYRGLFIPNDGWSEAWYRDAVCGDYIWSQSEKVIQRRRQKRELETILWNSLVDFDVDVNLGEWLIRMEAR
ncbi:hypothetical protein AX16_006028 [Volvariella volvacea WC 439]|nr:hypothetical protein AX16_006028 [Volvariella volvacea WC 439]